MIWLSCTATEHNEATPSVWVLPFLNLSSAIPAYVLAKHWLHNQHCLVEVWRKGYNMELVV